MSSFVLKIIAYSTMLCDHIAELSLKNLIFFKYIGRFAFPIFAFQAFLGFKHTHNLTKYFFRLIILAIISQIPFSLYFNTSHLNVIFTIIFGIIAVYIYDIIVKKDVLQIINTSNNKSSQGKLNFILSITTRFSAIILVGIIALIAELLKTDYGCIGVLMIFMFYLTEGKTIFRILGYTTLVVSLFIKHISKHFTSIYIYEAIFTLLAIIPILLYNNKKGKDLKFLTYSFYPLHLIILYLLKLQFFS